MKKRTFVIITLLTCLLSATASAQTPKTVRILGKVVSDSLKTPVPFGFVANSETGIGKETNIHGLFLLDISPNDTILFRCMGYEDAQWALNDVYTKGDTLILEATPKTYALKEIKVLNFRSYAAFRHKVAHMEDMYHEFKMPFKIEVGKALAEQKANSGTFSYSFRLPHKTENKETREYKALLNKEKVYERYNNLTSRDNLQTFTDLEGAKLDSFIVFLRSKHNIDPKLNDYDLMAAINEVYQDFIALQSDTTKITME